MSEGAALPRRERLRGPGEIARVFREGRKLEQGSFGVRWVEARGDRRVLFAAGRRLGGSVIRSRARRRLREAYRRTKDEAPREGLRLVVVAKAGVLTVAWEGLLAEMRAALRGIRARSVGERTARDSRG